MPSPTATTIKHTPVKPTQKSILAGCLAVATILVLAVVICLVAFYPSGKNAKPTPDVPTEFGGYSVCQQFLEKKLKAPGTAEYQPLDETIHSLNGLLFTVTAYVDAQNSFGALIRRTFNCQVVYAGKDIWNLILVELNE